MLRTGLSLLCTPFTHPSPRTPFTAHIRFTRAMSSFTLAESGVRVNSIPGLSEDDLLSFPAFKGWISTVQRSLAQQKHSTHEFYHDPYQLRTIDIQSIDRFGGGRLGFVKMKADVSNSRGETLPGSIFLRGGSVAILLVIQPDDIPPSEEKGKKAILTIQPRIPAGSLSFAEIPAGMLDDSGTFAGGAAKEIEEETGLLVKQEELVDMTALALDLTDEAQEAKKEPHRGEVLQKAVYASAGGSDEFIPVLLWQKRMPRKDIDELQGKLTGLRDHGEKITLKVIPLENLWKEGVRDGKSLAAWALYQGLKREGKL